MHRPTFLSLAVCLLASSALAQSADELLARHGEWRGEGFPALGSFHSRGVLQTAGLEGTIERWAERHGRSRTDVDLGVLKVSQGQTQEAGWIVTPAGQVEDASPHAVAAARREAGVLLGRLDGARLRLLRPDEGAGVRADFEDGAAYDLLLEPGTGALRGVRITEDGETRTVSYSDWRMVDGVRMPFEEAVDYPGEDQDQQIRIEDLELNAPPADATFERPTPVSRLSFAGNGASSGPIAFDFFAERRIYLPVVVNGQDVEALLDSGAETTVIDRAFAGRLGLRPEGTVSAEGTGGETTVGVAGGVSVRLGDATLSGITAAIMDLSGLASRLGRPLPVILGKELLNEAVVDIDFAARRLEVHAPDRYAPPANALETPALSVGGVRTVPVSLEGRSPVQATFDLGNGSPLIVYPAYAARESLLTDRPASLSLGGGVGGVRIQPIATLDRLGFGGVGFEGVPATFPAAGTAVFDTDQVAANVGLPLISRFRLITDFPRNRIFLIPRPDARGPFDRDRAGLRTRLEGGQWVVEFVAPGSPAEAGGWKVGDMIALLNDRPVAELPANQWTGGPEGAVISLTLADGSRRELTLRSYF